MKRLIVSWIIALTLIPVFSFAQLWEKSFDKDVNFVKMTAPGVAIIGTDEALYALDKNGTVLWSNEKLRKVEAERIEILTGTELIFVSDKGMLARNRVLNVLTGVEYANTGTKGENIFAATAIHPMNAVIVMPGGERLQAWDIKNNTMLWDISDMAPYGIATNKMASLTATFKGMQPIQYTSKSSGIVHLGLGHLAELDFKTGQPKWQFDFKPYKLKKPNGDKGDRDSNPSDGYAMMTLDKTSNTLYFPFRNQLLAINAATGQPKWAPNANKLGKIRDMFVIPEGILVLNINGLQLIDPATGATKWDKPLKVKGAESGLLVKDGSKFYMVSKKYLLEIDPAAKSATQLTDKIKFDGGESFSSIEMVDDLIVLGSSQNIVGINKNTGDIAYQKYFKAPGPGLGTILQNVALATVAAAATLNSQRIGQQNANANGSYTYNQYTPAMMDAGVHKSSASRDFKYINTKFKGDGFGLAKINKKTGEEADRIIIGDRSPNYAQNEVDKLIVFQSDKKSVACRKMN